MESKATAQSALEGNQARLLGALEQLLTLPAENVTVALGYVADLVASVFHADKVDVFVYDETRDCLAALGTSQQPLSNQQRALGLDVMPVSNGGRIVEVFQTGEAALSNHVDKDPGELKGIREALGIRSQLSVPLTIGARRRGVITLASQSSSAYTAEDRRFLESVARWVGIVAHRAELVEQIAQSAVEQGRRAGAEELMTILAHDLRNHVLPIELRLGQLRRRAEAESRADDLRDLAKLQKTVERMSGLISDLLDIARIDEGMFRVDLREVDLVHLLEQSTQTLSTSEQPIHIRSAGRLTLAADPARLRQCLENLLANSLKHSPEGAPITVDVARERDDHQEWVAVHVIDEGPGVNPDVLPRIFDRFVSGQMNRGGLGLGLYLAKRIALLHGGELNVHSTPGKGTRFTLRLPYKPWEGAEDPDDVRGSAS
jgi:two-component system, OmpR family, sensor kinase